MIQGLLTRPATDDIIKAFIKSVGGTLHSDGPEFKSVDLDKPIACFGVLRGTGEIIKKVRSDRYYFDHAYLYGNRHQPSKQIGERIYRLTKNWQHITKIYPLSEKDKKRIEKYQHLIDIKPWKQNQGTYIVICDISEHAKKYYSSYKDANSPEVDNYDFKDWDTHTIARWKHLSGQREGPYLPRKRHKNSPEPVETTLHSAYAVVTFQSTIGIRAVMEGIPHYCDFTSMCAPVSRTGRGESSVEKIMDPFRPNNRKEWVDSLLANQFTMSEIADGTAWEHVKDIPGEKVNFYYKMPVLHMSEDKWFGGKKIATLKNLEWLRPIDPKTGKRTMLNLAKDKKTGKFIYDGPGKQVKRTVRDMPNQVKVQPQKQ